MFEAFLHANRINKTKLMKQLKISRATLYNWFGKRELPMDTLALLKNELGFVPEKSSNDARHTPVQYDIKPLSYEAVQSTRGNIIRVPLHAVAGFLHGYRNKVIDGLCYKIFEKIKDERAFFISLNPESDNIDFHLKEIKGLYFVKNIIKNPY